MKKSYSKYLQDKRGQVTIFIIIAVLVVAGVVLFFLLSGDEDSSGPSDTSDTQISSPESYMKTCMEDDVRRIITEISLIGGNIENSPKKEFQFNNEPPRKISYLCYTPGVYKTCKIMEPTLISHLGNKIKERVKSDSLVSNCWDSLKESYRNEGYSVGGQYNDYEINLKRDKAIINLSNVDLTINKGEETIIKDEIQIEMMTKIYNNAFAAKDVAIEQSKYGQFNEMGYMELYPETDIQWTPAPNSTKIYTVKNKQTNEKFRFAIRSLVPLKDI